MRTLDPIAAPDSVEHRLELKALAKFGATELMATYDALQSALEVVSGALNQPRCSTADGRSYNGAGHELERLAEHLGESARLVVKAAESLEPTALHDGETRSWLLLKAQVDYQEDLSEIAALAARCAADNARADFLNRHNGSA